jgi:uncharacterized protein involved in exopolysaccharide biosynthesis
MRIIVTSIIAAVLLAVGAGAVLSSAQKPVYQTRAMPSVRIDDPGNNLVGLDWSGLPKAAASGTKVSHAATEPR